MSKDFKILISGFEPFLDIKINPTEVCVLSLKQNLNKDLKFSRSYLENFTLESQALDVLQSVVWQCVVLPVDYKLSFAILNEHIEAFKPDLVLATGVAEGRMQPELERIAINHRSQFVPDNSGLKPRSNKISDHGPDGVFCNFDVDHVVSLINKNPIEQSLIQMTQAQLFSSEDLKSLPLKVSNSAGTYVCNSLMYQLLMKAQRQEPNQNGNSMEQKYFQAGFLHIPNHVSDEDINRTQNLVLNLCFQIYKIIETTK